MILSSSLCRHAAAAPLLQALSYFFDCYFRRRLLLRVDYFADFRHAWRHYAITLLRC